MVAPIRDDQPIVAQQVTDAGAAIRVMFGRVRVPDLAGAITAVLDQPAYRAAAERLQASFRAAWRRGRRGRRPGGPGPR